VVDGLKIKGKQEDPGFASQRYTMICAWPSIH
jgi:hypothetical protein